MTGESRALAACYIRGSHASGFTLVELVTSLILVAVLSALAAPVLLDHQPFAERGYADELADSIRYTQRIAIASQCTTRIVINAANFTSTERNTCNAGAWNRTLLRTDGSEVSGTAPAAVLTNPNTVITFDGFGNIVGAPPGALTVGPFSVSIDPTTGMVTVQ